MPTVELWAKDGYVSTPDGNSIYFWGFARSREDKAQLPGPVITARQGEPLTVRLANLLPEPVSLSFPGQIGVTVDGSPVRPQYKDGKLVSFTNHALPGESVSYTLVPTSPGTFLYESGSNPPKQVPLGLYGGLVVRPADYNPEIKEYKTAYGYGTDTAFDREYLLITGEIDPEFHQAAAEGRPYESSRYKPRYWTLNGRSAPDTMLPDNAAHLPHQPYGAMIMARPGEKVLLRYIGAGTAHHPLHPHGNHTRVLALDGRLLRNGAFDRSYERFTVLVGAGQTCDQIYQWFGLGYSPENPIPTVLPNLRNLGIGDAGWTMWSGSPYLGLKGDIPKGVVSFNEEGEYYFMLHSHQEFQITNWGEFPGGLMTMIAVHPHLSPDRGVLKESERGTGYGNSV